MYKERDGYRMNMKNNSKMNIKIKKDNNPIIKRVLISLLIFSFVFVEVFLAGANGMVVNAADIYDLDANTNYISFGNLSKGDQPDYQQIILTNDTDRAVSIIWYKSDPDNFLYVDAPSNSTINAHGTAVYYVKAKTDVGAGVHRASIYFADSSDASYMYGECVDVSMTIREEKPYVTSVSVTPGNISVTRNSNIRFGVNVSGGNNFNSNVDWSISGQNGNTYIDNSGTLSIGSNENASSITVRATSKQDSSVYGTATVTITKDKYTVTVSANPNNGGAVTGGGTVDENGNVSLVASPYTGYQFVRWLQDGREISTSAKYTINNVNENKNIVAEFKQVNCKVRVLSNHSYGGSVTGDSTVPYGSDLTITAKANPGYRFDGWYENNNKVSDNASYKMSVQGDHTYTAMFNPNTYSVISGVSPAGAGTITGIGDYNQGDTATLRAKPADGYVFTGWFLNGAEFSQNDQITISGVNKDYSFVAYFTKKGITTYNVTSSTADSNGTISPDGNYLIPQGSSATYAITPKSGYVIADVKVDNVSIGAVSSYTFTNVTSAHNIVVSFKPQPEPPKHEEHNNGSNTGNTNANNTGNNNAGNNNSGNNTGNNNTGNNNANAGNNTSYDNNISNGVNNNANNNANVKVDNSDDLSRPVDDINLDDEVGILQEYNISDEQAINLIRNGGGQEMFEKALHDGTFQINIYNELGNEVGAIYSIFEFNESEVSLPNLKDVLGGMLTDQDLLDILHSKDVRISFNIFNNTNSIDENERKYLQTALFGGMQIGEYFEIVILKTVDGVTTEITELSKPMTVRIAVPMDLRQDGRSYYIIRSHKDKDGFVKTDILTDIDSDSNKVAFESDRFSAYALAYTVPYSEQKTTSSGNVNVKDTNNTNGIAVLGIVVGGCALTLVCVNGAIAGKKRRKKK